MLAGAAAEEPFRDANFRRVGYHEKQSAKDDRGAGAPPREQAEDSQAGTARSSDRAIDPASQTTDRPARPRPQAGRPATQKQAGSHLQADLQHPQPQPSRTIPEGGPGGSSRRSRPDAASSKASSNPQRRRPQRSSAPSSGELTQQPSPRQASRPSLTATAAISRPTSGSSHHAPMRALPSRPTSRAPAR